MDFFEIKYANDSINIITGWESIEEFKAWQNENFAEFGLPEQKQCIETFANFEFPTNDEIHGAVRAGIRARKAGANETIIILNSDTFIPEKWKIKPGSIIRQGIIAYYKGNSIVNWGLTPNMVELNSCEKIIKNIEDEYEYERGYNGM